MRDNIFQGELIPEGTLLAGYSYLISKHEISSYVQFPACVSQSHIRGTFVSRENWQVYDKRYWPGEDDINHLIFALKHEAFDLLSLKRILDVFTRQELENYVISKQTGIYARKIWFLYEWLNDFKLNVSDCPRCQTISILNPEKYFTVNGVYIKRYHLNNNLLGSRQFSPTIRKTQQLQDFIKSDIKANIEKVIGKVSKSLIARAASFLLLADSKASFAIEGERAPASRIENWGKAVLQAGKFPLTKEEIIRLQKIIIRDTRFTHIGFRKDGVFLGERDHDGNPLPEFIGAIPDDLEILIDGVINANNGLTADGLDPVLHATAIAFGFVYIHPLEDGNGRLHRYLLHHVLAERNFSPPGFVFPISSSMLERINEYRNILQNHSRPLMDFIEWKTTTKQNIEVLNQTRDLYSYFDCTEACEFIYSCVCETINKNLPEELNYLRCHDRAMEKIRNTFDIPDNIVKKMIIFITQNNGTLSKKRRNSEFSKFTDDEVYEIENIISEAFSN